MADNAFATIVDNSAQIRNAFNQQVLKGAKAIGQAAEAHAKRECPVGTPESTGKPGYIGGTLRGSISNTVTSESLDVSIYIGTNVKYAPYVEFIDRYKHAEGTNAHFLRNAAANHNDEYKAIMEAAIKA